MIYYYVSCIFGFLTPFSYKVLKLNIMVSPLAGFLKTGMDLLYSEIMTVSYKNDMEHTNTLFEQSLDFLLLNLAVYCINKL